MRYDQYDVEASGSLLRYELAKKAAKIKVNKKLDDGIDNSPFIQKKMEKGARILAVAGLPKI